MKQLIILTVCLLGFIGISRADRDRAIQVNELPQKAQEFIKQHFAGKDIALAKEEKDLMGTSYEVSFVGGNKVEFDKNGEWEEVNCKYSEVPAAIVPQAIRDVVAKQYPDAKILKIERSTRKYEVKLNNRLELKFTPDFKLYEIDD